MGDELFRQDSLKLNRRCQPNDSVFAISPQQLPVVDDITATETAIRINKVTTRSSESGWRFHPPSPLQKFLHLTSRYKKRRPSLSKDQLQETLRNPVTFLSKLLKVCFLNAGCPLCKPAPGCGCSPFIFITAYNKQKWAEDRTLWNTCQRLLFIIGEQHHVSQLDTI